LAAILRLLREGKDGMAFLTVGINQPWRRPDSFVGLAEDLAASKRAGADFVELMPHDLGAILGDDSTPAGYCPFNSCCLRRTWPALSMPR
jgi:hypothetical protein